MITDKIAIMLNKLFTATKNKPLESLEPPPQSPIHTNLNGIKRNNNTQQQIKKCEYGVVKYCKTCGIMFVATKWCGELLCQPCLDMAWLIDDDYAVEMLFTCCPAHRPLVMDVLIEDHPCQVNTINTINEPKDLETTKTQTLLPTTSNNYNIPQSDPIETMNPMNPIPITPISPILHTTNSGITPEQKKTEKQQSFVQSFQDLIFRNNKRA